MSTDKKYVGTYYSEQQLLDEIHRQKINGHQESDMYIVTERTDDINMIRGRTDAEVETAGDENWLQKVKHFIKGEEPIHGAFEKMGFSKEQANGYYREAKKGGMLLFVDKEFSRTRDDELNGFPNSKEADDFKTRVGGEPAVALKGETDNMDRQPENKSTYDPKDPLQRAAAGEYVEEADDVTVGDRITKEKIKDQINDAGESAHLDHRVDDDKSHR